LPNLVIWVTWITELFSYSGHRRKPKKPNLAINLEVRYSVTRALACNHLITVLAMTPAGLCPPNSARSEVCGGTTNFSFSWIAIWAKWNLNDCHCLSKEWPQLQMNHSINSYSL
jgi:hypothetical protein